MRGDALRSLLDGAGSVDAIAYRLGVAADATFAVLAFEPGSRDEVEGALERERVLDLVALYGEAFRQRSAAVHARADDLRPAARPGPRAAAASRRGRLATSSSERGTRSASDCGRASGRSSRTCATFRVRAARPTRCCARSRRTAARTSPTSRPRARASRSSSSATSSRSVRSCDRRSCAGCVEHDAAHGTDVHRDAARVPRRVRRHPARGGVRERAREHVPLPAAPPRRGRRHQPRRSGRTAACSSWTCALRRRSREDRRRRAPPDPDAAARSRSGRRSASRPSATSCSSGRSTPDAEGWGECVAMTRAAVLLGVRRRRAGGHHAGSCSRCCSLPTTLDGRPRRVDRSSRSTATAWRRRRSRRRSSTPSCARAGVSLGVAPRRDARSRRVRRVGRDRGLDPGAARPGRRLPRAGLSPHQAEDRARAGTSNPSARCASGSATSCCRSTPTPRTRSPTRTTSRSSTRSTCC